MNLDLAEVSKTLQCFFFSHLLAQFGPDQENTSRESVLACVSKSL